MAALLTLFRSGAELQRQPLDLTALISRLPLDALTIDVQAPQAVSADADLLAAALLNLFDNSLRNGATRVQVSTPTATTVRLDDNGPGVSPERRRELQSAIAAQAYEGSTGLGLVLADLVARAHGGVLLIPDVSGGFAIELRLGPCGE
ncbi:MAG: ATP-binding protein [Candidatus Accumulibacter delftensis]